MGFFVEGYSGSPLLAPTQYPVTVATTLTELPITGPDADAVWSQVLPTFSLTTVTWGSGIQARTLSLETPGRNMGYGFTLHVQYTYLEGLAFSLNTEGGIDQIISEHPTNTESMGQTDPIQVTVEPRIPDIASGAVRYGGYVFPNVVDGRTLEHLDRVLVKDNGVLNAVYEIRKDGSAGIGSNAVLAADYLDNNYVALPGYWHEVQHGTVNGGKKFEIANVDVIPQYNVGQIVFSEITDPGNRWDIRNQYDYLGNPLYVP